MFMIVSVLMAVPRAAIALIYLFTDPRWTSVIESRKMKILGFVALPCTMLAWIVIHKAAGDVDLEKKSHLVVVALALLFDIASWVGGGRLLPGRKKK